MINHKHSPDHSLTYNNIVHYGYSQHLHTWAAVQDNLRQM